MKDLFSLLTCLFLNLGTRSVLWKLNLINFNNLIHLVTPYSSQHQATQTPISLPPAWPKSLPTKLHLWPFSTAPNQLWAKKEGCRQPQAQPWQPQAQPLPRQAAKPKEPTSQSGLASPTPRFWAHKQHPKICSSSTTSKKVTAPPKIFSRVSISTFFSTSKKCLCLPSFLFLLCESQLLLLSF